MSSTNDQNVWLITGYALSFQNISIMAHVSYRASRGIGLELTRQLLRSPSNTVIAACRNPARASGLIDVKSAADKKGTLHIVTLDVTDSASCKKCVGDVVEILGSKGIDYLINNAGLVRLRPTFPSAAI